MTDQVTSKVKYKGTLADIYKKAEKYETAQEVSYYELSDWTILDNPKSKYNNAFFICPHCGATFANIIWIQHTESRGELKCLMCTANIYIDFGKEDNPELNPVQDVKVKVKDIKEKDKDKYPI